MNPCFDTARVAPLLAALLAGSLVYAGQTTAAPVAGTAPAQRPSDAPVINEHAKPDGWYSQALHGVERPYPNSLRFLEDQGAWHTPFNRPGMPGRYDLRGWHPD